MKTILVIGSSWEQEELLRTIKRAGHRIVATNPVMNREGFLLADVTYVKDARDIGAHLAIAETHKVDAVVTDNCDFSFYSASVVCSKLDLPFAPIQSAVYCVDKEAQRDRCREHGITQPEFRSVRTWDDCQAVAKDIGFPLVLKPVDSRGTFGVTIVRSRDDLAEAYYDAIAHSDARRLICEQFIKGELVTVDGFVFSNGHRSLGVASRKHEPGEKPVTKEIIYPAKFSDYTNRRLMKAHDDVVRALGYDRGHTHGEYLLSDLDDQIYLVECSNRGGGVYTSSVIVPFLTDIDLNQVLLDQALGQDRFRVTQEGLELMKRSAALTFTDFRVGGVMSSNNFKEMSEKSHVLRFRSIFGINDMIESIENCASRHSMAVITGDELQIMEKNLKGFKAELHVEYFDHG